MAAFVSRYASAFADVVTREHLDAAALGRQLDDFLSTLDGSVELRALFANPAIAATQKVAILDKLNTKLGLQKQLRNLLAVLINNDRIGEVREVAAAWRAEMQARQGIRPVEIVTARKLGKRESDNLVAGVSKLAGAPIEASFTLDKSILGGTVVRIGSTVYDGSLRGRLDRLKEALVAE
jgi:F-type H+-transporting ATPase subunit delta